MVTLFQGSFKIIGNKHKCGDTLFLEKQLCIAYDYIQSEIVEFANKFLGLLWNFNP
jgi:hypothetical protein